MSLPDISPQEFAAGPATDPPAAQDARPPGADLSTRSSKGRLVEGRTRPTGPTLHPPSDARLSLRRAVLWPSWLLAGLLAAAFALGLEAPPLWVQSLPFAASLVFLGLPHGAVDHLAPARLLARKPWPRPMLVVGLVYLILSGLYLALWFASPAAAFVLFIALTWFHWGGGDLYSLLAITRARYLETEGLRLLTLLVRGGLPMLVPLLAFPEVYRSTAQSLIGLFDPGASASLDWAFSPAFGLLAGALFIALVLCTLVLGYRRARAIEDRAAWREDAFETVLLAAYFAFVPPLLAVGLYFCLWHSARFVARLMLLDGASPLREGRLVPALRAFLLDAAPLTTVALVMLAGLYLMVPESPEGVPAALALYLVLISALTLPHVAVVLWMDREEGLFASPNSGSSR